MGRFGQGLAKISGFSTSLLTNNKRKTPQALIHMHIPCQNKTQFKETLISCKKASVICRLSIGNLA